MTLHLDTLERHRKETSRLFMLNPRVASREVVQISELLELHQDEWNCAKTYTVFVRVGLLFCNKLSNTCFNVFF